MNNILYIFTTWFYVIQSIAVFSPPKMLSESVLCSFGIVLLWKAVYLELTWEWKIIEKKRFTTQRDWKNALELMKMFENVFTATIKIYILI